MYRGSFTPGKLEGAGTPFNWPAAIGYGRQPFANLIAGKGALTAGAAGVQIGIFGWADPNTGEVSNTQIEGGALGFVLPVIGMYNWQRVSRTRGPTGAPALILRAGMQCVLAAAGDFVTSFPFGGQAGDQVFTDPATGLPYSGNPGAFVATPWTVMESRCECNAQIRISSFTKPLN